MAIQPRIAGLLLLFVVAVTTPRAASAQVDITGEWGNRFHEDFWHRMAGPEVGDYTGMPINEAARLMADTWDAGIWSLKEYQCRPHPGPYILRGPANIRISTELQPFTRQIIAYTIVGMFNGRADRTIWMDGRPHPPADARHTWEGFSTGVWEGNTLTVTTTHLKKSYMQRNGVDFSDQAVVREHFTRHGNVLTVVVVINDPIYLEEPFVRSMNWELDPNLRITGILPCGPAQSAEEVAVRPQGFVPHHLPGMNDQLKEFTSKWGIPLEASKGGAVTTYPEYKQRLQQLLAESAASNATSTAASRSESDDPFAGAWILNRSKSKFGGIIPAPDKRTMRYALEGDSITHTTDTTPIANDRGFNRVEYTAKFDGKQYPVRGSNLDTVTMKRIDKRTIERAGAGKQVTETATSTVSPDGKTLTVATKGTINGIAYDYLQVFERE